MPEVVLSRNAAGALSFGQRRGMKRSFHSYSFPFLRSFIFDQNRTNVKKYPLIAMRKFLIVKSSSTKPSENEKKSTDDTKSGDGLTPAEDRPAKRVKFDSPSSARTISNKPEPSRVNKVETDFSAINFECTKTCQKGDKANFKIISWNVAGIRACINKNAFQYVHKEDADIICLQEVKCPTNKLPPEVNIPGYHKFWHPAAKAGYSGVGLLSKTKPISFKYGLGNRELDSEGRLITVEYDKFYVVTTYVPNSGDGLKTLPKRVQWNIALRKYLKSLDEKKPVILAGDLNVAHQEIDIAKPESNRKTPGFTEKEREDMTALLGDGFVDSFRALYPERTGAYSFWSYLANHRNNNIGWRLDYFLVSERLMNCVCDSVIRSEVNGSDHCPVVLYLSV